MHRWFFCVFGRIPPSGKAEIIRSAGDYGEERYRGMFSGHGRRHGEGDKKEVMQGGSSAFLEESPFLTK